MQKKTSLSIALNIKIL